jgi:quinolinate synthase
VTRTSDFPTLRVLEDRFEADGAFAQAQAQYLRPDPDAVRALDALLAERRIGVVAHYYMDPELQGALASCTWPHIHISDSLVMADRAVDFARAGCAAVVVLGVDFMSENARAMLDKAGFAHVPVYRAAAEPIGCSLAAAADTLTYEAWLAKAAKTPRSLHVVYINTSLRTKARSHARVPTITCTSSNVVQTVLSAFAAVPDAHVWFGPDTYMGANLGRLFDTLATFDDDAIRALHPAHDRASVKALRARFDWFRQGNCVVHHMFGAEVVRRVRAEEPDALITAHLEVPGEMFELALEARAQDRGAVGSTSDILKFVSRKVKAAVAEGGAPRGEVRARHRGGDGDLHRARRAAHAARAPGLGGHGGGGVPRGERGHRGHGGGGPRGGPRVERGGRVQHRGGLRDLPVHEDELPRRADGPREARGRARRRRPRGLSPRGDRRAGGWARGGRRGRGAHSAHATLSANGRAARGAAERHSHAQRGDERAAGLR